MTTSGGHRGGTPVDLYVSPHLDDAVLSCGGRIAAAGREGRSVAVASVFAAPMPDQVISPVGRSYHKLMGIGEDNFLRRREDHEALELLGARAVHLKYLDCIYRVRVNTLPLVLQDSDIFRFDEFEEQEILQTVSEDLYVLAVEMRVRRIFLPLALGWHRDHVLTRRAGEMAVRRLPDIDVLYFEDVPYAVAEPDGLAEATQQMRADVFSLTWAEFGARLDAISRYRSQQSILWHKGNGLIPAIRDYASRVGNGAPAERYWHTMQWQRTGRGLAALL